MTEAYVAHLSVQYTFTSHGARRSTIFFRVALVTPPTFPVQQLPGVPIQAFQIQSFCRFLQVMPHLIQFQDDGSPRGLWLLLVLPGKGADPG